MTKFDRERHMITVYDFEDGLQHVLSYVLSTATSIRYWDRKGFLSEIEDTSGKNIVIMSKPYDCLHRGVLRNKYEDERGLKDCSRRNWRYSNPEIYEHINEIINRMEDVLIILPEDFANDSIRKKIFDFIKLDIKASDEKLIQIYKENVNIK